jgi:hypothetical protein
MPAGHAIETYQRLKDELTLSELRAVKALLDADLAAEDRKLTGKKHSVMEFRGIAPDHMHGKDAQEYISELRDEWDRPR